MAAPSTKSPKGKIPTLTVATKISRSVVSGAGSLTTKFKKLNEINLLIAQSIRNSEVGGMLNKSMKKQ
jgi:hypothetical protein